MQNFRKIIFYTFSIAFFAPRTMVAQEVQVTIHAAESFYVHSGENVGIFSDISVSGTIGTKPSSTISFFGQRWSNRAGSRLVDESTDGFSGQGGDFRFRSSSNSTQFIENQADRSDNSFPNLTIANSGNINIEGADITVRRNLNFESGHLILNNRNLILPVTGTITGYDNNKFVVTGAGVNGGSLIRNFSGQQSPDLVFPIGVNVNSYTPASLNYRGVSQNIKVRVFENVYDKATFGIPDNINFVPRTWSVSFGANDQSAVLALNLQHNRSEEGSNFTNNRIESFISRFVQPDGPWDKSSAVGVGIGNITSGTAISNAFLNSRATISSLSQNEYFSKSVIKSSGLLGLRIPEGISPNNDGLNEKFVIENLKPGDKVRLDIYNRWQTLVFRDGDYKNTFDGIGNQRGLINSELPDGTYYYILNINAEKPITGYIIINR